jgi:hypothetical protein
MEQRLTAAPHLKPLDRAQPARVETATFATG